LRASVEISLRLRGNDAKNASKRPRSAGICSGNCQRIGPSFSRSASTPDAKKFASAVSTSRSFFMCVMKRPPLTANTKPGGVRSYQWV
jgi:hypothetical protein